MHRFVWDLHYPPPQGVRRSYPITAVYRQTPSHPLGPWVHPGQYAIRLTVDGRSVEQPLSVRLDPRVRISGSALREQFDLSMICYQGYQRATGARGRIHRLRAQIQKLLDAGSLGPLAPQLFELEKSAAEIEGKGIPRAPDLLYSSVYAESPGSATLSGMQRRFLYLLELLQGADAKPTSQASAAVGEEQRVLEEVVKRSEGLGGGLGPVNDQLRRSRRSPLQWGQE
ncbi:MAG: hypothetical protein ACE5JX_13155 [Acidobacteriota bacterium]